MDPSEQRTRRPSPRRELQGPRPTPLKVQKDSHKIKKPPLAPPPQHRPPVIIYTVSPKVIHTTPGDFMSLVQRLTGASSSSSAAAAAAPRSPSNVNTTGEALSPAARLATIEKGAHKLDEEMQRKNGEDVLDQLGIDGGMTTMNRHSSFPGRCICNENHII
ncbi:protein MKS1 isoform X2 [Elaeis guineensis]|uniref:Nuclear speckle RNA-binding protein B isoform X2 n=1 Tax=Elaeis guineensis var. tenera TaxID=51953 RepID=A0A8N4I7I9_ELAGV|nr:nuclear speckle RNA-binding protein B isoform X2 [Elaeis guineensis]